MNNIFCKIQNKFLDFLGFENTNFFHRKTKNVVFSYKKSVTNTTFYVFRPQNLLFSKPKKSENLLQI